jgi:hypothetical protein
MGDKYFLERCLASMREGVVPAEKYSHLPALEIPVEIGVCMLDFLKRFNGVPERRPHIK